MSQTKAQLISDLVQALNFTGTASAPANGAFLSATNTLALATNSAQRLTIKSDGGVAVGTTDLTTVGSPNKNFVVGSTTNAQEVATTLNVMEGTNNRRVKFFLDDDDGVFGIDSTASTGVAPFVVRMAQSEKIRIDQSGNLTFSMEDSSNYPTQQIKWSNDSTTTNGFYIAQHSDRLGRIWHEQGLSIVFGTSNTERMRIHHDGYVGIGTTSPGSVLHVDTGLSGSPLVTFHQTNGASSADAGLEVETSSTGTYIQRWKNSGTEHARITGAGLMGIGTAIPTHLLHLESASSPSLKILDTTNDVNLLLYSQDANSHIGTYSNHPLVFDTNSSERMRIDSSGRLLIGTTTPDPFGNRQLTVASSSSAHLEIRSGTSASGIIVFTDGTSGGTDSFKAQIKYNQASDFMSFSTNGANERLRIDSIGNVMMGTTTASGALTVVSTKNAESGRSNAQNYHLHLRNNENDNGEAIGISFGITSSSTGVGASILHERDSSGSQGSLQFYTNGDGSNVAERMRIDSSGNIGIGTTSPSANLHLKDGSGNTEIKLQGGASTANDVIAFLNSAGSTRGNITYDTDNDFVLFNVNTSERMRITNGGDLVLNSTSARVYNGHTPKLSIQGTNFSQSTLAITSNSNGTDGAYLFFVKQRSGSVGGSTAPSNGDLVGQFRYLAGDGTDTQSEVANISVNIDGTPGSNDTPGRITFATTNDGGNASTERMRITNAGHVHIGNGHGNANHRINGNGFTQGQTFLVVSAYSSSAQDTAIFFGVDSAGGNTASCGLKLGRNSSNLRSLNAGGTLNASGSDYAEYMTKSSDFTLAKGAICGINAEGKLTNKFSESISFVVKSTDPSYVGGDTWGSEDILGKKPKDKSSELPAYEEKMEAARKMVDRIAFSGQVPVNVTGTTPGQHIIPTLGTDDSITGVAKAEASLSMAEYISSVGKVIALESDGRARIIVKVA